MNHTPVQVITATNTNITTKHRAVIVSNTDASLTTVLTLQFLDINNLNTGNFVIRLAANSGPFYIPCRVKSFTVTSGTGSILLLV